MSPEKVVVTSDHLHACRIVSNPLINMTNLNLLLRPLSGQMTPTLLLTAGTLMISAEMPGQQRS